MPEEEGDSGEASWALGLGQKRRRLPGCLGEARAAVVGALGMPGACLESLWLLNGPRTKEKSLSPDRRGEQYWASTGLDP